MNENRLNLFKDSGLVVFRKSDNTLAYGRVFSFSDSGIEVQTLEGRREEISNDVIVHLIPSTGYSLNISWHDLVPVFKLWQNLDPIERGFGELIKLAIEKFGGTEEIWAIALCEANVYFSLDSNLRLKPRVRAELLELARNKISEKQENHNFLKWATLCALLDCPYLSSHDRIVLRETFAMLINYVRRELSLIDISQLSKYRITPKIEVPKNLVPLLAKVGISSDLGDILRLLHKCLGSSYSKLMLDICGIQLDFSVRTIREAENIKENRDVYWYPVPKFSQELFTIDHETTEDYDDAIGLKKIRNGWEIYIAIADLSEYCHKGSSLLRSSVTRGLSLYLPDLKVGMLPDSITDELCSLKEKVERHAILTRLKVNSHGEVSILDLEPVKVKISSNLTYEKVNKLINTGHDIFTELYKVARILRIRRLNSGALIIASPRYKLWLEGGRIRYKVFHPNTPAYIIVSELMIALNSIMGELFNSYEIPGIYRAQEPPSQELMETIEALGSRVITDPHKVYIIKSYLPKSFYTIRPKPHYLLGCRCYLLFSSPLRRVFDLINHLQLKSLLLKYEPLFTEEELYNIIELALPQFKMKEIVSQLVTQFWLYNYLKDSNYRKLILSIVDKGEREALAWAPQLSAILKLRSHELESLDIGNPTEFILVGTDVYKGELEVERVQDSKGELTDEIRS